MTGPTNDSGGMMAFTREPSVRRASTIGRGLVDAPADRGDDAVDDAHDVVVVLEDDVRELELAGALDVDLARAVDHDLGDRLVAQERLERTETDDLVRDLLEHPDPLGTRQREAFLVDDLAEDLLDLAPHLDLVGQVELRVQVLDDPALDPELDVPERLANRRLRLETRGGRRRGRTTGGGCRQVRDRSARGRCFSGTTRSSTLDPLQQGHDLHPFSTSGPELVGLIDHDDQRHANNDFFGAGLRASSVADATCVRSPVTVRASRRMSWETCASRLLRKNGTPRFSA